MLSVAVGRQVLHRQLLHLACTVRAQAPCLFVLAVFCIVWGAHVECSHIEFVFDVNKPTIFYVVDAAPRPLLGGTLSPCYINLLCAPLH